MPDAKMEIVRSCFEQASRLYLEHAIYDSYKLGSIWTNHTLTLSKEIRETQSVDQFLRNRNSNRATTLAIHGEKARRSIAWLQAYLEQVDRPVTSFGSEISESKYCPDSTCITIGNRRVSSDLLWRLTLIERMERSIIFPDSSFFVCELGSGSANFMRILKILHPRMTGVLIDLPETLAIAHANLVACFPDAKILYITDMDSKYDFSEMDFILVPTAFREVISDLKYHLFINCNSMGEMQNFVMKYWIDFVQDTLNVKYSFFLNRFLNCIDPETMGYRLDENKASLLYGRGWEILDWEVDPSFERNPYATGGARNLLFVARRAPSPSREIALQSAEKLIAEIDQEDWFIDAYPKFLSRGERELTPDLSRTGALFKVWEAYRQAKTPETVSALLKYLLVLGGTAVPFEETYALKLEQMSFEQD
jgi:putative sugar O-methyltransferase